MFFFIVQFQYTIKIMTTEQERFCIALFEFGTSYWFCHAENSSVILILPRQELSN